MSARQRKHLVRPRWVWGGTLTAIAGTITLGVGVTELSWPVSGVGIVVLLVGALVAIAGGVMYDVHSGSPSVELDQVVHGKVHEGVAPGDELSNPRIQRTARELDQRRRALEQASIDAPRPSFIQPAGGLLGLIALFLLVSQWELYPTELPGQDNALRALGCAVVLGLAGMRLLAAQPGSPHLITGGFTLLAALALILNGFLAPHDRTSTAAAEVICGALAALAGVVAITREDSARSESRMERRS